jgi:aspartate carbamoyltransferase catalytic subunit
MRYDLAAPMAAKRPAKKSTDAAPPKPAPSTWGGLLSRSRWTRRHLLGIRELAKEDLLEVLDLAAALKATPEADLRAVAPLRGRRLLTFFVESSTRTKSSFGIAARGLGAEVLDLSPAGSSLSKGESLKDSAQTLDAMGLRFAVVRHTASGAPHYLADHVDAAILNAGDGLNEHPTQALLDLMTVREKLGRLTGLKVALVGDIAHSRVARSNLWAHKLLGNEVTVCGPATLIPRTIESMGARVSHDFDEVVSSHDVVMMLRLQLERQAAGLFPSRMEYERFWGLTRDRLARIQAQAIIMHPGPMNRGLEISGEAADHARSVVLDQVTNGVFVRMAALLLVDRVK